MIEETGETAGAGTFAAEYEKYLKESDDNVEVGNIIHGTVVSIDKEQVGIDIGFKSFGYVPRAQCLDSDGNLTCAIGDQIEVLILALESDDSQVLLSHEKAVQKRVWGEVEEIFKKEGTLRGRVVQKVKGGLHVDIGIPAFLPGSQIDIRPHRNLDKFLGEEFEFKVLKITKEKGNIVLSRRALLVSERDQLRTETLKVLAEGVVMEGIVKNITDYGAFIDLGGIDGLLHITDISWGRVNHPSEKLSVGDSVPVVVLKYDQEKERVSLGMKQLKDDPWETVNERFPVGGKVEGKVASIADYGAFLELEEGVEGLIHVSEMSWTKKVRNPGKMLNEGDLVEAVVLGIDAEQQRINLGIKQLTPNPWETLSERHPIGEKIVGKVRSVMDFGIFIGVEEGIDGLVHVSDFSWTKKVKDPKEIQDMFTKGDEVEAIVLDIDPPNERLSLGIKQLDEDPWDTIAQRYPVGSKVSGTVTSSADFGIFIEIEDGIEGLIHNSEMFGGDDDDEEGGDDKYKVGATLECEVINVDREERRISLSEKAIRRREQKAAMTDFSEDSAPSVTFGDLIRDKMGGGSDD